MKITGILFISLLALSCANSGPNAFEAASPTVPPKIYVANEQSNNVTVIAQNTNHVIGSISVGEQPVDLAFHRRHNELYVANFLSKSITIIDASVDTVRQTLSLSRFPIGIAVSGGDSLFILARTGNSNIFSIYIFDSNKHTISDSIALPSDCWAFKDILFGHENKLYITGMLVGLCFIFPTNPLIFDLQTRQVQKYNSIEANIMAFSPDTASIYFLDRFGISIYDIAADELTLIRAGDHLISLVFSPVLPEVYVAKADSILIVDTEQRVISSRFRISEVPGSITISQNGAFLYVSYPEISLISVLDLTGQLITTIPVGQSPRTLIAARF